MNSYNTKVAVVKVLNCDISSAFRKSLELIDFDINKLNQEIIIKPNLVSASLPKEGKTTTPNFIDCIIKIIKRKNKIVSVGDSVTCTTEAMRLLKQTGIKRVCENNSIEFKQFEKLPQELINVPSCIKKIAVPKELIAAYFTMLSFLGYNISFYSELL